MSATTEFIIGTAVVCSDGPAGSLQRVIIDPMARTITHLVVEPKHRRGAGHLVPVSLVSSSAEEIELACTTTEFHALEDAEEIRYIPGASGSWNYQQSEMMSMAYYPLGVGMTTGMAGAGMGAGPQPLVTHHVPAGEVEVRRGDHVHAIDGAIGRVRGLVINPSDHQVTHVLLDEGHLWGEKRVVIPIANVTALDDGVQLNLTKNDIRELPDVDVDIS